MKKYLLTLFCFVSISAFASCPLQFEGWNTREGSAAFNLEAETIIEKVKTYCHQNTCTDATRRSQYVKAFSEYKKAGCSELVMDHLKTITKMKLKGK